MFSVNIGAALFSERKRRRLLLVRNPTIVPFVTGDQPVINLHATTPLPPTQLSFYYPISPTLALILSESDEEPVYSSGSLSPIQASQLNGQMLESSHSQVFGNSKEVLASLLSPLGDDAA
jgi:hypothetical protein